MSLGELIDTQRYPLENSDNATYKKAVATARLSLAAEGCAVLKRFIRDHTLRLMSEEIIDRKAATHFSEDSINPYFHTQDTAAYPARHPMNTFLERSSGFIPGDACESGTINHTLFEHPAVGRFLADCLGLCALYPYSDPLAGLTSNIQEPGQQFTWHFDTNEFADTILVDAADQGGLFEYVPGIRSAQRRTSTKSETFMKEAKRGSER